MIFYFISTKIYSIHWKNIFRKRILRKDHLVEKNLFQKHRCCFQKKTECNECILKMLPSINTTRVLHMIQHRETLAEVTVTEGRIALFSVSFYSHQHWNQRCIYQQTGLTFERPSEHPSYIWVLCIPRYRVFQTDIEDKRIWIL